MGVKGNRNNIVEKPQKRKRDTSKHTMLCERGSRWLKKHDQNILIPNCPIIATDMVTIELETPDIIGWSTLSSVMIEVKVSRTDFLKDKNKLFRLEPELGVGELRFYLCPENLIKENELPEKWGLLYINDKNKISIIKIPERQSSNMIAERNMLLSIIRRKNDEIRKLK